MSLTSALVGAVLPILAVAAAGALLGRALAVDVDPLNTVTLYLLVPALVFHSLATTTLSAATIGRLAVGATAFVLAMAAVAEGVGRLLGEPEPYLSALVLAATFPNVGNFGIPLSSFAFGPVGRTTAVVYTTVMGVLMFTVGIWLAARSGGEDAAGAVSAVFELPLVYAAVAALLARWLGAVPPADGAAMQTVKLLGDASIPLLLVVLGIQLSEVDVRNVSRVAAPVALKLLVAPAVGLGVALALGFSDATVARVFVLEAAAPTAVLPLA
ncbi:MAG: AEC family transporter, partial [Halobacteriales archaeon]